MRFFETSIVSRSSLVMLFLLKLMAAAAVWLIYTFHFSSQADFFTFFSDSSVAISKLTGSSGGEFSGAWNGSFDNSFISGAKIMIIINAFLHLFSFGNFYVHAVIFCFLSFIGLVALGKGLFKYFPGKRNVIILSLFFIPDVLFWGSAPLKESLIIAATGLFLYVSDFGLKRHFTKKEIILLLLMLVMLFLLGLYVFAALLPLILVNMWVSRTSAQHLLLKHLVVFGVCGVLLFGLSMVNQDYNILRIISDKQAKAISESRGGVFLQNSECFISVDYNLKDQILIPVGDSTFRIRNGSSYWSWPLENMADTAFVSDSKDSSIYKILYFVTPANSVVAIKRLDPDLGSFIKALPMGFLNSLIHPTIFEIHSWLHLIECVENLWIGIIILLALFFFDKEVIKQKQILLFCLIFSVMLLTLIGIMTPAIGSLVRYRSVPLLYFVITILISVDQEKLSKMLKR